MIYSKRNIGFPLAVVIGLAAILAFPLLCPSREVAPKKGVASPSPSLAVMAGADQFKSWDRSFEDVYKTLLLNLNMPNEYFAVRYAYPSPTFRSAYLWDTAFIAQVWKPWDAAVAQEINQAVIDHAVDGRLPHFANRHSKSEYTQPPVMTWSVWQNYLWSGDIEYLGRVYPALRDYNHWYYQNRRLDCGLFYWIHSYESGIDNSPRFSSRDEKVKKDLTRLAAIDVNAYLVMQNQVLALIADELGRGDEAAEFETKARELTDLVNTMMWDPVTGYYYDLDVISGQLQKIRTIASLFPLFAGIPAQDRAEIIRKHVMNPREFNTTLPLPSTALDDPTFEKDCWRGPIWINTAYMAIVGMERYGFMDDAAELSMKLAEGVYKTYENTGKFVEFYDPERYDFIQLSRKKGNLFKRFQNGNKPKPQFVGWTGLANTLVIEHLAGFKKDRGKKRLEPNLPARAQGVVLRLTLPGESLEIEMEALAGGVNKVRIMNNGKTTDATIKNQEAFPLD